MAVTLDAAADLSLSLIRIMKLFQSMRHHAPRLHPAVEASAYPVLFNLHAGPKRVSELADCVHSDVSTVSRQATAIVSHGLAEKVTDPADGRAQVITLTPEGIALLERIKDQRARWFQDMLADWAPEDIAGFTAYLSRFGDALEASRATTIARHGANPHDTQEN
ncbi:MAG TPA: MarR family transcriptional regulator [Pedococcus sp.]|nr:MarR family transcriptional regulator [Pedococcus sp.]